MHAVKVVPFGLLLSFSALNGVESGCRYFQNLEAGQKYYAYNPGFPGRYIGEHHCIWQMTSPYVTKINCSINIPDCGRDMLSVQFAGGNIFKYCGYRTYILEGIDPIITFDLSSFSQGGQFLCEIQTEKDWNGNNCHCGWKKVTRIVGGEETGINEYPMMCGLIDSMKNEYEMLYCGCTIISEQYVLTAAHCIERKNLNMIGVVVGEHNIATGGDTKATRLFRLIGCLIHPQYQSNGNANNDIAVCKIFGSIEYSAEVGPVCLPFQRKGYSFVDSDVTALGWGLLEYAGNKPTVLQKVKLNVITLQKCGNYYPIVRDSNICTFTLGKDTCQMDSGGPLLWQNPTTQNLVLAGITSSGVGCASENPAIAIRTGAFIDWIVSVTPGKNRQKDESEV